MRISKASEFAVKERMKALLAKIDSTPEGVNTKIEKVERICQAKGYRFEIMQGVNPLCIKKKVADKWTCSNYDNMDDLINQEGFNE